VKSRNGTAIGECPGRFVSTRRSFGDDCYGTRRRQTGINHSQPQRAACSGFQEPWKKKPNDCLQKLVWLETVQQSYPAMAHQCPMPRHPESFEAFDRSVATKKLRISWPFLNSLLQSSKLLFCVRQHLAALIERIMLRKNKLGDPLQQTHHSFCIGLGTNEIKAITRQ
jgi:hypothetical protein